MTHNMPSRILVVDDEPYVREIISEWLRAAGYACRVADSGQRAMNFLAAETFDLVVSDINMPGMDGVALLTHIRKLYPNTAVIMVTAVDDRAVAIHTLELGAYGYVIKPFTKNEILINMVNALERRRLRLLSQEYERSLEFQVKERTQDVRDREKEIIFRLLSATGYRDDETGEHVKRVGLCAAVIARALGWEPQAVENMTLAAPMHDIGKIGVPDAVLRKPGKLSAEEFEVMKTHAAIGAEILTGSEVPLIRLAEEIALSHHEKWDGSGYPKGLSGVAIPESGRIVALVDVYDALTHDRVYRPAFSEEQSVAMMAEGRGRHFDPRLYDCFMDLRHEMRRIWAELPDKEKISH